MKRVSLLKSRIKIIKFLLVIFLVTGNIGYGMEVTSDLINENIIKEENQTAVFLNGEKLNITNYGTISGKRISFSSNWDNTWGNGIGGHKASGNKTNSSIGNIINLGIINGYSHYNAYSGVGNGISSFSGSENSFLGDIKNSGIIAGETISAPGGNGIEVYAGKLFHIGNITNLGSIKGITDGNHSTSGNGIHIQGRGNNNNIGKINNTGLISGYSYEGFWGMANGISISGKTESLFLNNKGSISGYLFNNKHNNVRIGNGVSFPYSQIDTLKLNNYGVIKGSNNALAYNDVIFIKQNNNFGVLAGKNILMPGSSQPKPVNFGIEILVDSNGNITNIENGTGGEIMLEDRNKKIVINSQRYDENRYETSNDSDAKDSYILANGTNYKNNIINGAGINKGTLVIQAGISISESIVNGYNTAVYLEDNAQLTAINTILNGGGLKNDTPIIKGSSGDNTISILGESVINGSSDLGAGDDRLKIANTVQINGNLDGGVGNDILNLGEMTTEKIMTNLNILYSISNFENINTNGNITLFETVKITGTNDITLESGNLILRIDPTIMLNGKVIGHALYENNGTLSSKGGNLIVGLNGIGTGTVISMGGTTITPETDDKWWKNTDYIKTNSLVLDGKLSEDGKDIGITVLESIPLTPSVPSINPEPPIVPPINPEPDITIDSLLYEKLNKIYQSIVSAEEIGKLANTTLLEDKTYNESLGNLLVILNQIYANTPYSYSIKASRDSMKVFEDNMSYFTIKPNKGEWIVQGKGIYTGVKRDNVSSGKNYYGFDIGSINNKTTTSINGGIATAEYGISNVSSIGFAVGGNHQNTNFKGDNSLKGNSMYLGIFGKKEFNNLKLMAGAGYQYTSVDAERNAANNYDYFKTGDKYNVNGFNLFAEGKYEYNIENNWSIAPKIKLSYYHIIQENINEGHKPEELSMSVSRAKNDLIDAEIGTDLIKTINIEEGKLKGIISLGIVQSLGDRERELTGKIQGKNKRRSNFDIQGAKVPKTSGKASLNIEYEKTNGLIYTAGTEMEFSKDYNRNISVKLGLGYRF